MTTKIICTLTEYREIVQAGLRHTYDVGIEHFPGADIEFCMARGKLPSECVQFLGIKYRLVERDKRGDSEKRWGGE